MDTGHERPVAGGERVAGQDGHAPAGPASPYRRASGRPRRLRVWQVLLVVLLVYALGVLIASATGGGESSGVCEETTVVVDSCLDGGE